MSAGAKAPALLREAQECAVVGDAVARLATFPEAKSWKARVWQLNFALEVERMRRGMVLP